MFGQIRVKKDAYNLIISSFLMLFIELVLIRWIGTHILHVSFFSNFVLLASFLGIGIGFLLKKNKFNWFYLSPLALGTLIFLSYQFSFNYEIQLNPEQNDLDYHLTYFKNAHIPIFFSLPIIFLIVCFSMSTVAYQVAQFFEKLEPIDAYRFNILGSLLGIVIFTLLSFLHVQPIWWSVTIILLYMILLITMSKRNLVLIGIYAILFSIAFYFVHKQSHYTTVWSPYYRITLEKYLYDRYVVNVNGLPQQTIESVAQRKLLKPFYFIPYHYKPTHSVLNHVLIVGAGTGGDVAIALSEGAKHVDAVEIDPVLYHLGKKLNPNHPFSDPRVHVYINDGRAFLQNHLKKYDMIIYALPDSVMLVSGQSSLRLENYLFTLEGISEIYQHLNRNGIFSFYNYMNEDWAIDRLANTLSIVFNHAPCMDVNTVNGMKTATLSINRNALLVCSHPWQTPSHQQYISPSIDDHPFIHLKENKLSGFYLFMMMFILIMSMASLKIVNGTTRIFKNQFEFFCMGAAFTLLETKSIVTEALLFGSTWVVNALVFIGILITVYMAIELITHIKPVRKIVLYGILLMTLFFAWIFPTHYLLVLPFTLRFITATVLAFSPIFVANILFTELFRNVRQSTDAFAANILGGVFGGLLEYSALIYGYRDLLLIVAFLYFMALIAIPYLYQLKKV